MPGSIGNQLTLSKGRSHMDAVLPRILEDAGLNLSGSFRVLLAQLQLEPNQLTGRIERMDAANPQEEQMAKAQALESV